MNQGYQPYPALPGGRIAPPPRDPNEPPHDEGLRRSRACEVLLSLGYLWVMGGWVAPAPAPVEPAWIDPKHGLTLPFADSEPVSNHKINATGSVAVATDVFWNHDMASCPRGVKVQLLGAGGVAAYGVYNGDTFWTDWAPVPRRRPEA